MDVPQSITLLLLASDSTWLSHWPSIGCSDLSPAIREWFSRTNGHLNCGATRDIRQNETFCLMSAARMAGNPRKSLIS